MAWRVPFLTLRATYAAAAFEAEIALGRRGSPLIASREGASVRVSARVTLRPDPSRILTLHEGPGPAYRDARALARFLTPSLAAAAAERPYDALLALGGQDRVGIGHALAAGAAHAGLLIVSIAELRIWPEIDAPGIETREPAGPRILLVGLDGADWTLIDPLLQSGRLPTLARIVASGVRARLKTITPVLSPILWTSIATGKRPEKHGIIDFLAIDSRTGESIPVTSTMRKAKAFWNILSGRGITVGTVGWWATWPAERVLGFQVSDRVAYQLFGRPAGEGLRARTYPEGLILSLAPSAEAARQEAEADLQEVLGRPHAAADPDEQALQRILTSTRIYHRSAVSLLREYGPRVAAVYYEGTDTVAHLFMRYAPPRMPGVSLDQVERWGRVLERYYVLQDRLLAEVIEAAGAGTTVIVVSDHGFKSGAARPQTDPRIGVGGAADWHRKFGIFAASGPGIRKGVIVDDVSVLDVTPTLLTLLRLPAAADMDGSVVEAALESPAGMGGEIPNPIASYEGEGVTPGVRSAGEGEDRSAPEVAKEMIARLTALGYIGQTGANADNNTGITLLQNGRHAEAVEAFRSALAQEPAFQAARVNLARALMAGGDLEGAMKELQQVRAADPAAPDVENLIGNIRLQRGELAAAEATFRQALEADPRNPHLWNSLGIALEKLGRADEAITAYRRVVDIDPDYAEAINNIGLVLRSLGRLKEAASEFERAIRTDADFAGSYNNLGLTYQDAGDHRAALSAFDSGLRVDPENPVILNSRGSALMALGRFPEARTAFEAAVAADPEYAEAHSNLGAVQGALGDALSEFEEYLKAIELDPNYADARFNLALNLKHRGRTGEADRALREVLRVDPAHVRANLELGLLEVGEGRPEKAIPYLEKARILAPRMPGVRNALARALLAAGRREEALKEARASLSLDPNQPEVARLVEELRLTSGSKP